MNAIIRNKAEARKQKLLRELQQIEAFVEYQKLTTFIEMYDLLSAGEQPIAATPKPIPATPQKESVSDQARDEQQSVATSPTKDVIKAAEEFLEGKSFPTPTRSLYVALLQRGIRISGKDPQRNLSTILSHSDLFKAHGRKGWTLIRADDAANKPISENAATDEDENGSATQDLSLENAPYEP